MGLLSVCPGIFGGVEGYVISQIDSRKGESAVWAECITFSGDPQGSARSARFGGDVRFEIHRRLDL